MMLTSFLSWPASRTWVRGYNINIKVQVRRASEADLRPREQRQPVSKIVTFWRETALQTEESYHRYFVFLILVGMPLN